jgi:hypothetical protein
MVFDSSFQLFAGNFFMRSAVQKRELLGTCNCTWNSAYNTAKPGKRETVLPLTPRLCETMLRGTHCVGVYCEGIDGDTGCACP